MVLRVAIPLKKGGFENMGLRLNEVKMKLKNDDYGGIYAYKHGSHETIR